MPRYNPYTMNINKERNCYNFRGFEHLARNCRNWEIVGKKEDLSMETIRIIQVI